MASKHQLNNPRLVAVWPGMGHVAINAGIYLLSRLQMTHFAEFEAASLFDAEQVEVKEGLILPMRRPRNRMFYWNDPSGRNDLLVFLGESQPPLGKYTFCQELIRHVKTLGVTRVDTFAAMATGMHPEHPSKVFAAATDGERLQELQQLELKLVEDGHIGGLNGILLGVAAEAGMTGTCLLGEMPHIFSQLPFPKGSLAILEVYSAMTGIELDLTELEEQSKAVEEHLGELLEKIQSRMITEEDEEESEFPVPSEVEEERNPEDILRIETLFEQAASNRSKAFELKKELDRLGLFKEYENRFLDLFRAPDEGN